MDIEDDRLTSYDVTLHEGDLIKHTPATKTDECFNMLDRFIKTFE